MILNDFNDYYRDTGVVCYFCESQPPPLEYVTPTGLLDKMEKERKNKSMHNLDTPNQIEVKKFIPVQIPDKIQTFKPRNNDYQPFNNDYKPNAPGNNWKNQYHPQHPVNNPANSNWNQPTFTWSPIPLPFWND